MKLTAILITAFTLTASAASYSQNKVSLKVSEIAISEAISKIEAQTSYRFLYNANLQGVNNKISVKLSEASIDATMAALLKGTELSYQVLENNLIVIKGAAEARQDGVVTGKVVDEKGEELVGVSVKLKGTNRGASTDVNGNFKLSVPANGVLVVNYIGFEIKEVPVKGQKNIKISLKSSTSALDEVVVVGYGTAKKKDLTGAVTSIGAKELGKIPLSNTASAIQGRMPGVQVQQTEGSPDAEMSLRIRGGGSISQDNSPLYIVDGFPVASIANISPTDIASIDILKDAASSAIYGARGANGVFIITTKGGSEGKTSVNYNGFVGMRTIMNYIPVLNPYEYTYYQYELDQSKTFSQYYGDFFDLDIYKAQKGTNWQKEVFGRTAYQQNHNVSINGGTKATKYSLGITRADEDAIMLGSGFQRNNVNLKLNTEVNKWVNVDFITRFAHTTINGAGTSNGTGANSRLRNSVKYAPTRGLRAFSDNIDDDQGAEAASLLFDPVLSTNDEYKKQVRVNANFNAAVNWTPIKNLRFRTEGGYDLNRNRTDQFWGESTSNARQYEGKSIVRLNPTESDTWRIANTVNYSFDIKKGHNINAMLGQELMSVTGKSITNESRMFPLGISRKDALAMMNLGTPIPIVTYINEPSNLASFFGRINYSGSDKYLASVTFRADGSSKFAQGNKWGYFPSGSVGWRIGEEDFMKSSKVWLSNLKVRASLGMAGNNRIDDGLWQLLYSTASENKPYFPGEAESAQLIPGSRLANPNLKWETTVSRNVGLDFGFLNNRISGTFDWYHNTTRDLLIDAPIPTSTGYASQMQNVGRTSNRGIELAIDAQIVQKKDWGINFAFNVARNWNKVDQFRNGDQNFKLYTSNWNGSASPVGDFLIREGQSVGQMFGYVTDGMYSFDDFTFDATNNKWILNAGVPDNSALTGAGNNFGPGSLKFKKLVDNGSNVVGLDDRQVIGNGMPEWTGGFNLGGNYKGFDLSVFCNFVYGVDVYNANKIDYSTFGQTRRYQNISSQFSLANRFTVIDPSTGYNVMYGSNANPTRLRELNQNANIWSPIMTSTPFHSWAVEDGSFLRVNNITLGYTFPSSMIKKALIKSLRIYATAYNLHTFTKYTGMDPEVSTRRDTPLTPNVDYSAYPKSRQFVAGVNVSF